MKSDFIIISILFISGLFACNGNNNIQLVKEWQGKEIKLPSFLLETFNQDTIWTYDADFTIL